MTLRFLVDESTGSHVASYLVDAGYDAQAVAHVLPQAADTEILIYADQGNRIVITNDKDFGDFVFLSLLEHRGVILLRTEDQRPSARWRILEQVIQRYGERLIGAFTVITDDGFRIRN